MLNMLNEYKDPKQIKNMSIKDLNVLAGEIREFLIESVSKTGGHLSSNLGVVELTLSLFNVFDFECDKIVWDVGHQSYVHKILTGRKDKFDTLRKHEGLSGFPKRHESEYDFFDTGHSSTSISAALGMARARDIKGSNHNVIAVIGDGALTGGMALEALNDVGYNKTKLIVVLNDNQMSISKNVGGISTYLSQIRVDPSYNKLKNEFNNTMEKTILGKGIVSSINKLKDSIKQIVVPGMLFEEMGLTYLGPIDGHNIKEVSKVLTMAKELEGPVIIHTLTQKGKGYNFAEQNPNKFHGVSPFNCKSGESASQSGKNYSGTFGEELMSIANMDNNVVAITAAMPDGTGLKSFATKYPKRFFDVGIAEQHAVTLAAGMAAEGLKPVVAIYSTFLQRAYDQVLHDVCIQNLPVVFAIDRAGIVGEDGETHQGIFDISYLNSMPNMTLVSPKTMDELRVMLRWACKYDKGPVAIRYPRGGDCKTDLKPLQSIEYGKWERISHGNNNIIIATGKMVQHAVIAKDMLKECGIDVDIINATFIKPMDNNMLDQLAEQKCNIITIEDNVLKGGLGEGIVNYLNKKGFTDKIITLGYDDKFIFQGDSKLLYRENELDAEGIVKVVKNLN